MSLLCKMSNEFFVASSDEKSCDSEIEELLHFSKIEVPYEFIQIIKEKTELEIEVNKEKYIRIWGAKGCMELNEAYSIQKYIPESLAIGDDECSNVILYANGNKGFGVYIVSLGDLDVEEMVYLAESLESFFVMGNGVDTFNTVW